MIVVYRLFVLATFRRNFDRNASSIGKWFDLFLQLIIGLDKPTDGWFTNRFSGRQVDI